MKKNKRKKGNQNKIKKTSKRKYRQSKAKAIKYSINNNLSEIPSPMIVVDYEMFFETPPPATVEERVELIKHIPKICLILEFASLNYRLKKWDESSYNCDKETQQKELLYFCGENDSTYKYYSDKIANYFKDNGFIENYIIFNRASNLFALQEIISYGAEIPCEGFNMREAWGDTFKYYLAVNSVTSDYKVKSTKGFSSFQELTAGHTFLGVLNVCNDVLLTFDRFPAIIDFFSNDNILSDYFGSHFKPLGFDPERYMLYISELFFNLFNEDIPDNLRCYFKIPIEYKEVLNILNTLSLKNTHLAPKHNFDLTQVKKSPFYKISETEYILLDCDFLVQKSFQLFINDYYFDYIKPNNDIGYDLYASKIGYFFENYVSKILKFLFNTNNIIVKTLDELKSGVKGSEIELADLFIKDKNKIILGQIKASALNNQQNDGSVESLFSDKKNFLKDFGLQQTLESIEYLSKYPKEFDSSISESEKYEIYPMIILNDLLASTPMLPMLFQEELLNYLKDKNYTNLIVKPITLIHIQDLETIKIYYENKKIDIWKILDYNFKDSLFPKPFYITLNRLGIKKIKLNPQEYNFVKFINLK